MIREGYKETEIGLIPQDWEIHFTEQVLRKEKNSLKIGPFGSQLKKKYLTDSGYKVYGQENVFNNDFLIGNRYLDEERYQSLKSCEIKPHDLLITMMGTIGKTAIVPEGINLGIMDSHLIRLRVSEDIATNEFIRHSLKSSLVIKQIERLSVGGIMAGLSSSIIKKLKFVIPPIQEQQRIAYILSTTDNHIEHLDKLIEAYQLLMKGMMKKLLTEGIGHTKFKETEIGRIPRDWQMTSLGKLANIKRGASPRPIKDQKWFSSNSKIGWIRISDVTRSNKYLITTEQYLSEEGIKKSRPVFRGDLIMSICASIGVPIILEMDACIHDGFVVFSNLKTDKTSVDFLYYYLNYIHDTFKGKGQTGTQANINTDLVNNTNLGLPSLSEQKQITFVLNIMDKKLNLLQQEHQDFIQLKKALMDKLLTGKIRTTELKSMEG